MFSFCFDVQIVRTFFTLNTSQLLFLYLCSYHCLLCFPSYLLNNSFNSVITCLIFLFLFFSSVSDYKIYNVLPVPNFASQFIFTFNISHLSSFVFKYLFSSSCSFIFLFIKTQHFKHIFK